METIIENGKKMEGIPYPVAVWDAKHDFWDDSIVETFPAPSACMLYLFHTPTSSEKVKTRILRTLIQIMRNTRNGTCSNMRNGTRAKKTN